MLKRSEIRTIILLLAAICLIVFLFGDVIRGKSWEMGPLQILGTGAGLGLLVSVLMDMLSFLKTWKVKWLTAAVCYLVVLFSLFSLKTASINDNSWSILLLQGLFTGTATGLLLSGFLVEKNITRSQVIETVLFLVILTPFWVWVLLNYINLDFWYDEVYSLKWFILVPVMNAVTDYNAPNNHIFFSLLSNIYLKIIGIQDINMLVENTDKLRMLMLVFSSIALFFLYLTGKKYFNRFTALSAMVIMATTIPFYNFAVQVRGYVLTIMLVCMLLYYLFGFEAHPTKKDGLLTILLTALLLYTIPTNLYFLAGIALFYAFVGFHQLLPEINAWKSNTIKNILQSILINKNLQITLFIATGCFIAFLFYIPILSQLYSNALIKDPLLFPFKVFYPTMVNTYLFLFSKRYLLIALMIFAIGFLIFKRKRSIVELQIEKTKQEKEFDQQEDKIRRLEILIDNWFFENIFLESSHGAAYWMSFSVFSLIFPFIASFFHGYDPYYRVFLFVVPVFSLFLSFCLSISYHAIPEIKFKPVWTIAFLVFYCYLSFAAGLANRDEHNLKDIQESQTSQNMYYNYYQAYYSPLRVFKDFVENHQDKDIPVFIYQWGDTQAIPLYATKFVIRHYKIESVEELFTTENRQIHILTVHPYQCIDEIHETYPNMTCSFLYDKPDYLGALECHCTSDSNKSSGCPPIQSLTP